MKKIKKLADKIEDEIHGAKEYAECYLTEKAKGNTSLANRYREMANDELKHATYIHDIAVSEIETLSKVYKPPQEMLDKWERVHNKYIEKVAWIKQMMAM